MRTEQIVLRTLGTARIDIGPVQVRPNAVRRFAALLYMSAEPGRRVPRRVLIDLLFPDQNERNGLHSLRELVYQLKAAGAALESDQEGVELRAGTVSSDYAEVLRAERLTIEQIRGAQGGFLPGYAPHQSEAYKEWYEPFRAKVCSGLSRALLCELGRARAVADWELAELAARACLAVSPLNEAATLALAEILAIGGAKVAAVDLLDAFMTEVGAKGRDLRIPAAILKRRIGERNPESYRAAGEFPFTGRDTQMLELRKHLAASVAGPSRGVVIFGDLGVGKSRMAAEFAAVAQFEDTHVRCFVAHPSDRGRPMGLLIDFVSVLHQMPGGLGIAPDSMNAIRRLTTRRRDAELFGQVCEESDLISHAIKRAIHDLVSAVSSECHLTIVIDDCQWCDPETMRVFSELVGNPSHRLLLVLTSRESWPASVGRTFEAAAAIRLEGLEQGAAIRLATRGLQGTAGEFDHSLQRWMVQVSHGNPLYLVSLLTHFRTTGQLFTVPPSLRELVARQLDSLAPNAAAILQTIVVLGSECTHQRLLKATQMPFVEIIAAVTELERLRLIRSAEGQVVPAHPLIAEVVQATASESVLRLLHLRVATLLEGEVEGPYSPTRLWRSADHWVAAGDDGRAFATLRQCAEHAEEIGRPAAAAEVMIRAASLANSDSVRIEVLMEAVRAARSAHEHELVLEAVAAIRRLSPIMVHDEIEIAELTSLSVIFVDSADFADRAMACLNCDAAEPDHRIRVALAALMYADTYSNPTLARQVSSAVRPSDLSMVDDLLRLEFNIVHCAASGEPALAARHARALRERAAHLPPSLAAVIETNVANAYWRAGLVDESISANLQAYDLAESCGALRPQLIAALHLADIMGDMGDNAGWSTWYSKAQRLRESSTRELGEFEIAAEEIALSLTHPSIEDAIRAFRAADAKQLFNTPIRRRWRRCFDARIRQLSDGIPISRTEITEILADWSDGTSTSGIRDSEATVLCSALAAEGSLQEARAVLNGFLAWRRRYSLGPIPWSLRQEMANCGIQDLLDAHSQLGAT